MTIFLVTIPFFRDKSPNSKKVVDWVKYHQVDIIVIMLGHILKEEIIAAPRIGIINKHAAMLPSCQGLFPYFWAALSDQPQGISFHVVTKEIDSGQILVQRKYKLAKSSSESPSMLRFYMDICHSFPPMIRLAIQRLLNREEELQTYKGDASYFSLPSPKDVRIFQSKGYSIARFSDLFYTPNKKNFVPVSEL